MSSNLWETNSALRRRQDATFRNLTAENLIFGGTGAPNTVLLKDSNGTPTWTPKAYISSENIAFGHLSGSTGTYRDVLQRNTFYGNSVATNYHAPSDSSEVGNNSFFGYKAGSAFINGATNTIIGSMGLQAATGCDSVTIVGSNSAQNGAGYRSDETYLGHQSGQGTSATNAVNGNTFIGARSGVGLTSGIRNSALGANTLRSITTGMNNIALGHSAGYTGTAITTGNNNILIGYNANVDSASSSNRIVIGNNAFNNADNTIKLGNADISLIGVASTGLCDIGSTAKPLKTIYATNFTGTSGFLQDLKLLSSGGTSSSLTYYEEYIDTAFQFSGAWTNPANTTIRITRVGNQITLTFPAVTNAATNNLTLVSAALPTRFRPASSLSQFISVVDNSGITVGRFSMATNGVITLYADNGTAAFTASGDAGTAYGTTISYSNSA